MKQLNNSKPKSIELLDSQKVELFEHIMQNGYNPADFEYKEYIYKIGKNSGTDYELSEIRYKPGDNYCFCVHVLLNNYSIRCTPYLKSLNHSTVVPDWSSVLTTLKTWLYAIHKEKGAKNVWELISTGQWNKEVCIPDSEFTCSEKIYIKNKLTELISLVSSDSRIDDASKKVFIKELEYSRSFVDIAPRKSDWFAALLFHLFMAFAETEPYHIVQNYVGQLLIGYGREFIMLVNRFLSSFTINNRKNYSFEV